MDLALAPEDQNGGNTEAPQSLPRVQGWNYHFKVAAPLPPEVGGLVRLDYTGLGLNLALFSLTQLIYTNL